MPFGLMSPLESCNETMPWSLMEFYPEGIDSWIHTVGRLFSYSPASLCWLGYARVVNDLLLCLIGGYRSPGVGMTRLMETCCYPPASVMMGLEASLG